MTLEPLVLLPGMMCDARLFAPQIAHFSAERAVQVAPISARDAVEALAAEVLGNAPPRFALLGLSMGGIVAMEVLRQAPDRISRIALLDTNHRAENDAVAARREPQIERVQAGELITVMRDEMKPNYLAPGPDREAILDLCMDMASALGPDVFIRQSRALQRRPDQTETLSKANLPALILCGEHDVLCPVHRHEAMAALMRQSTLEIIADAGHLSTLEQPKAVNAAIARWLAA